MFERLGLAEIFIEGKKVLISTVKISFADLPEEYETMVLYENGEDIESKHTFSRKDAVNFHNSLVHKYNDLIYKKSLAKSLGFENYGQFVNVKVSC